MHLIDKGLYINTKYFVSLCVRVLLIYVKFLSVNGLWDASLLALLKAMFRLNIPFFFDHRTLLLIQSATNLTSLATDRTTIRPSVYRSYLSGLCFPNDVKARLFILALRVSPKAYDALRPNQVMSSNLPNLGATCNNIAIFATRGDFYWLNLRFIPAYINNYTR